MIQLPRLTQLVQLVDPKTGLPTLRGSDFWNQMVSAIEANLSSIQTASGTITSNSTIISQILAGDTDVALLDHANTWLDAQTFDQALEAPGYNIDGVPVGGITADVGGTISTFRTLSAGTDMSLSGTGDDLTINFDGAAGLTFENSGTSVGVAGTINAPTGDGTWSVASGTASYVPPSGGGGSSPYTIPLLANFTVANTISGSTQADTSTGLALVDATSALQMHALADSAAVGSTATVTCGMNPSSTGASTFYGIYFEDASGKIVSFGGNVSANFGGLQITWSNFTSGASTVVNNTGIVYPKLLRVAYNGSTFVCLGGTDLNSMIELFSVSATAFISTPTSCGIFQCPNGAVCATVFFHYLHTA